MSVLKPNESVMAAAAVSAGVVMIYQHNLPNIAEVRNNRVNDGHLESARKQAAITSAALVAGVALITRDPTIYVIGGATMIAVDMMHKHANQVAPDTGRAAGTGQYDTTSAGAGGDPYAVPYIQDGPEGYGGYGDQVA